MHLKTIKSKLNVELCQLEDLLSGKKDPYTDNELNRIYDETYDKYIAVCKEIDKLEGR